MKVNIDPLYMKHQKPDVCYSIGRETSHCYDFIEDPKFFDRSLGLLNTRETFFWDIFTVGSNFWDIIKNQVHIFPSLYVDFGLVLSQKEIEYYIWNAYTTKSVYIQEPVTEGDYGTTFVVAIAGNFTLEPGKGTPALLTVYVEGPVSSSTDFVLNMTVEGEDPLTYTIYTEATRVIIFPFKADWSQKVEFSLKFNTVIFQSTQNYEQRRPLMAKPQRSIAFSHLDTTYGLVTNAVNFAQDKSIGIPIVYEMFTLVSMDSDKMGFTINEKTSELWNLKRFCNYVMLHECKTNILVAKKIISVEENKIYIENPVLEPFQNINDIAGYPMIIGVFKSISPKILNGNLVNWELAFSELIGENQPALTGVPALGIPITNNKFDWSQDVTMEQSLYRDIGEFTGTAQAVYSKYPLVKNSTKKLTCVYVWKSRAEMFSFLDFVAASKGRFKKFDYLWPMNEFQLVRGEYEGVNQVRVRNNFYAEQFSKVLNKKIILRYKGYSLETTITAATTNSEYTTLTFANATNFRIYDEDCDQVRIEQYKTVRFDLDEFTIECASGTVFIAKLRFAEVYE